MLHLSLPFSPGLCNLSSLSLSLPTSTRTFTTSAPLCESRLKRIARLKKKTNLEQRQLKTTLLESTKPDPILGIQLSNSNETASSSTGMSASPDSGTRTLSDPQSGPALWLNSDLNKIILSKEQVWGLSLDRRGSLIKIKDESNSEYEKRLNELMERFGGPKRLNFGLDSDPENRQLLFDDLGRTIVEDRILDSQYLQQDLTQMHLNDSSTSDQSHIGQEERNQILQAEMKALEEKEEQKKEALKRILDLKNSNGRGIQRENVKRIIQHFGQRNKEENAMGKGIDTASPEVQGEFWSQKSRVKVPDQRSESEQMERQKS